MEEQNIQEPEKVITGDTAKESLSKSIQGQNFKTDSRATNEQSKPFNPYSFLKEGRVPSANDMLEYHMQNNVNYIPDWDSFIKDNPSIAKTYGDETLGMLKQVVDQSIRDYAHGYFELDNTKLPDNQYNRLRYRDVKPERFTKAKLRVDGNPLFFEGPMRFQHTTQDQIAEKNSFAIDLTRFSTISEWYYVAIKQLISTKDFVEDENWIYKRLRKKVTLGQIKVALKNLEDLEIIKRDEQGKLKVIKPGLITSNDVPSSAIRKHHYGMMELGMQALLEQNVEQRQINSTSLKINKNDLPEAKKFIFDFIKEFASRFHIDESSNIYQLNVQLFELSKEIPSTTMEQ